MLGLDRYCHGPTALSVSYFQVVTPNQSILLLGDLIAFEGEGRFGHVGSRGCRRASRDTQSPILYGIEWGFVYELQLVQEVGEGPKQGA